MVARIYNMSLADEPGTRAITSDIVWNAFYLHALILHKAQRNRSLSLPHTGAHAERLNDALHERNILMAGTGQAQWAHACDDCEKVFRENPQDQSSPVCTFAFVVRLT